MRRKKRKIGILIGVIIMAGMIGFYIHGNPSKIGQPTIQLYLHQDGKIITMELEEYIVGTVAAEMPAAFETEALKAQAVCARTYAIKRLISNTPYPQGADLSDDISACQAFVSPVDFAPANRDRAELLDKIEEAVESTRGEILLYDSEPIDALYCSTCGGRTECASAVWGGRINYLQPVKCSDCSQSEHYKEEIQVANSTILGLAGGGDGQLKIRILSNTPGGRAQKIDINGKVFDATVVRQMLGLPSTWVEFHTRAKTTTITSRGYGHGVGLCQFGANGMAKRGKNYREILQKYYRGVTFYNLGY